MITVNLTLASYVLGRLNVILFKLFLPIIPDLIVVLALLVVSLRVSLTTEVAARLGSKPGLPEQADNECHRDGGNQGRHDRVVHLREIKEDVKK